MSGHLRQGARAPGDAGGSRRGGHPGQRVRGRPREREKGLNHVVQHFERYAHGQIRRSRRSAPGPPACAPVGRSPSETSVMRPGSELCVHVWAAMRAAPSSGTVAVFGQVLHSVVMRQPPPTAHALTGREACPGHASPTRFSPWNGHPPGMSKAGDHVWRVMASASASSWCPTAVGPLSCERGRPPPSSCCRTGPCRTTPGAFPANDRRRPACTRDSRTP
jgi:hypothetical protein